MLGVHVTRLMVEMRGRRVPLYLGEIPHRYLFDHCNVHPLDLMLNDGGYQRPLDRRHVNDIAKAEDAFTFGVVTVSVRGATEEPQLRFLSENGKTGVLEIPDSVRPYIIDGYHRTMAYDKDPDPSRVLAAAIFDGLTLNEETEGFLRLNYDIKKPTKSHGQALRVRNISFPKDNEQAVGWLAYQLSLRAASPWCLRVDTKRNTAQRGRKGKARGNAPLTTFTGLSDSIRLCLRQRKTAAGQAVTTPQFRDLPYERQADVLVLYSRALRHHFPETFRVADKYRLVSGLGLQVVHNLLAQHFSEKVDLSIATEDDLILVTKRMLSMQGEDFWLMGGPLSNRSSKSLTTAVTAAMIAGMEAGSLEVFERTFNDVISGRQQP